MPILNQRFYGRTLKGKQLNPMYGLLRFGPRVPVLVGVHSAVAKSLAASEKTIPSPVKGFGLIDTGASITSIDLKVAERLELPATGTKKLGTAGGPTDAPTYAFAFTLANLPPIDSAQGVGCELGAQGIIALIGLDLLSRCVFILNGPDGSFTLSL